MWCIKNRYKTLAIYLLLAFSTPTVFAQTKYITNLKSEEQFFMLEGKPLSDKYSGTKAVKVVLDLQRKELYFLSSKHYTYHRDFCTRVLNNHDELSSFNFNNYRSSYLRDYVFATINYYPERRIYTLEFADIEKFSIDVIRLYKLVKAKSFIGEKLFLHPITDNQLAFIKKSKEDLNIITSNELYNGIARQMLVKGSAIGRLRRIAIDTLSKTKINAWDIVLTNGSPNDIDLCAGLIITKFQSPLSHINILCHNRGTPVMAYKDAFYDTDILQYIGKPVRLEIAEDYQLSTAKPEELQRIIAAKRKGRERKLAIDRSFSELRSLKKLSFKDVKRVGGKAANLAELFNVRRLSKSCRLPEKGFAIPMFYYLDHFKKSGAQKMLTNLLKDSTKLGNSTQCKEQLKQIRTVIKNYSLDETVLMKIKEKLVELGYESGGRIRFRSSTNAEDIKGFNGAGLYGSYTGVYGASEGKTIERAVKKVWASVWKERAFKERDYFGINQRSVAMGVLVHRAFGTEELNGVAVTKNLYRKGDEAYIINAQKGEIAIVKGADSATTEISILSKSYFDGAIQNDYISYSSLNEGQALMNKQQIENLFNSLEKIKQHYYFRVRTDHNISYTDYALDVEFKIKKGQVIIKQARPFN